MIQAVGGRLVAAGHEVHLLTCGWPGAPREETLDGIIVHRFPGTLGPHLALPAFARHLRPDAVIDDLGHVVPWMSPQLTDRRGVAFFRHLHRRTLPGQVSPWLVPPLAQVERSYPRIYRRWTFAVESSSSASDLEALGAPADRITRIPPGVDLEAFRPGTRSVTPSLVFFSGLREYKRPEHAVRALALVRRAGVDCSLTIVGTAPADGRLLGVAESLGIGSEVRFSGKLPDSELTSLLQRAWVNVNCSVAEGWGISILEAAASGVPTSAYDVPGVREAIGVGATGTLVPDGDIPALADAIHVLLRDNDRWRPQSREFAERFPWSTTAQRWEELLRTTAG